MSIKVSSEFTTREISLVAFMDLHGIKPLDYIVSQKGARRMASFKFNKDEKFVEMKDKYFDGGSTVEPMAFMDAIRRIKTKINNMDV